MRCICRGGSFRVFVHGLAQVHNLPALAFMQQSSATLGSSTFRAAATTWPKMRAFSHSASRQGHGDSSSLDPDYEARVTNGSTSTAVPDEQPGGRRKRHGWKRDEGETLQQATKTFLKTPNSKSTSTQASSDAEPVRTEKPSTSRPIRAKQRAYPAPLPDDDRNHQQQQQPREDWQRQKQALKQKFPEGWRPRKRLSPDALAGIRALNAQFPDVYTTQALADRFEVSVESIRRILKSKWTPSVEEEQERQERWFRRGKQVWERKAALGIKPPRKWRREGIVRGPEWHAARQKAIRMERELEEEERQEERQKRARARDGRDGRDGSGGFDGGPE